MENKMILNVYDDDDNIIKTCQANYVEVRFGTVRKIMELLKVDNLSETGELLKTVYDSWGELTKILSKAFPEMEEKDWDNVKLTELIPILLTILKNSFVKISTIPTEKNSKAE